MSSKPASKSATGKTVKETIEKNVDVTVNTVYNAQLTKREMFAVTIFNGLASTGTVHDLETMATRAIRAADILISKLDNK